MRIHTITLTRSVAFVRWIVQFYGLLKAIFAQDDFLSEAVFTKAPTC